MSLLPALPIFNWSNRPSATAVPVGASIRIIDVGLPCGIVMTSDGVNWIPAGPQVIARSGAAVSVTGTTAEVAVLTVTLPGSLLALSGGIRATYGCSYTNNANSKTVRLKLGSTTLRSINRGTNLIDNFTDVLRNRGVTNAQHVMLFQTAASAVLSSHTTAAVDTTVANDLVISIQLATGTDTSTLEQATVELLP